MISDFLAAARGAALREREEARVALAPSLAPSIAPEVEDTLFGDQDTMFGEDEEFHATWQEWQGMPEFVQEDLAPAYSVIVHFASKADQAAFGKLIGQKIRTVSRKTPSLWYPKADIGRFADKRYRALQPIGPRAPVYVVSKGRSGTQLTSRSLDRMGVPHYVVVEAAERDAYAATAYPSATLLTLDPRYQREYDTCDDLGDTKGRGPGPARNFAWDHALGLGAAWHWVMDDNIDGFFRLNRNLKTPVADGSILRAMEAFVERYENVLMAGPNYFMFAPRKERAVPYVANTRIYSCNLIRNDAPFRWRGRYNEDTDLSLRMLKDGWCTIQFNAFLQLKLTTQTLGGGNTAEFYAAEGTRPKSEMLARLHPDVARVTERFGRVHHVVDYGPFSQFNRSGRNRLRRRPDAVVPSGVDNFSAVLERLDERTGAWRQVDSPWERMEVAT